MHSPLWEIGGWLFIDGSANNQRKVGCGAYLVVHENEVLNTSLKERIKTKTFTNTSSTQLELQTFIWAVSELEFTFQKWVVYTDSQNIIGLPARRSKLEEKNYHSSKNRLLNHHELYKEFFRIIDNLDCELVKVKGHQPYKNKDDTDHLFTLVDRAARKSLRDLKE